MIIFGHRGAAGEAPENTIAGIQRGISLGVKHFEIDIRLSADQKLVVLHDNNLLRTTGIDKPVHEMHSRDLAKVTVNGRNNETATGIPTLRDLLEQCPEIELIQLELKSDETTDKPLLTQKLVEFFPDDASTTKIVATSFDAELLTNLQVQAPHIPIGLVSQSNTLDSLTKARQLNCQFICLSHKLVDGWCAEVVQELKNSNLHVSLWTVNDPDFLNVIDALPVDSIITDFPSRFTGNS